MRNIFKLFTFNFKRNKAMLLLAVACSVLLCGLYEIGKGFVDFMGAGTIYVGVIDEDKSALSNNLQSYLTDSLKMEIITDNYDELSAKLLNKDISVIIEIPNGMQDSVLNKNADTLEITSLDDYENIAFIKAYLNSYMQGIMTIANSSDGNADDFSNMIGSIMADEITRENAVILNSEDERSKTGFSFAIGFFCMIIGLLSAFTSVSVLDDKRKQTYNRMKISNIKPFEYIIGTALFGIIILSICALGIYIYTGIKGANIGIPIGVSLVAVLLIILFIIGFSIMISLLSNSMNTVVSITIGFTSIACIVGGVYFPIDDSAGIIKKISYFTPHYWFTNIISHYDEINAFYYLLILALFVVLIYLVLAVTFAKKN